jgi:hypothetical protein
MEEEPAADESYGDDLTLEEVLMAFPHHDIYSVFAGAPSLSFDTLPYLTHVAMDAVLKNPALPGFLSQHPRFGSRDNGRPRCSHEFYAWLSKESDGAPSTEVAR